MQKLFFLLLIFLIIIRHVEQKPSFKNGDFIRITTVVTTEPIRYSDRVYLKIMGLKTYLPLYPEITYGDEIIIEGKVNDGRLLQVNLIKVSESNNPLFGIRKSIIEFYRSVLPEPMASLVAGTVLGSKNMPQSFWEKLKSTGTAHVVVASGTNVSMVSVFLMSILVFVVRRGIAIWITIAAIFIYIILSGFDAPIIRAGIMGGIVFLAQSRGRLVNSWRLLVLTAGVMLLIKPVWLTDLGFILSFVATMSLMLFQAKLDSKLQFVPKLLREGLSTSLVAQIGVAPIIFATFGQFNLLSPVINALILWTIPFIMVIGGAAALISFIVPSLARFVLLMVYPFTWWFNMIIQNA